MAWSKSVIKNMNKFILNNHSHIIFLILEVLLYWIDEEGAQINPINEHIEYKYPELSYPIPVA